MAFPVNSMTGLNRLPVIRVVLGNVALVRVPVKWWTFLVV